MNMRNLILFVAGIILFGGIAVAQKSSKPKAIHVDLSKEKVGRDSTKFLAVVGNWSVVDDGGTKVLGVDGREGRGGHSGKTRGRSTARVMKSSSITSRRLLPSLTLLPKTSMTFTTAKSRCVSNWWRASSTSAQAFSST